MIPEGGKGVWGGTYQDKGTKDEGKYSLTDICFVLTEFLK